MTGQIPNDLNEAWSGMQHAWSAMTSASTDSGFGCMSCSDGMLKLRHLLCQPLAGDGHFSPIAAYHRGLDHVLILDTARFKYPPHWVRLADLHSAMAATDGATGRCRGYLRITRASRRDSTLFTLDISNEYAPALFVAEGACETCQLLAGLD